MGHSIYWSKEPIFAPQDYKDSITESVVREKDGQTWMFTPEVLIEDHPWSDKVGVKIFPNDELTYLVIAMQHAIHPHSGDVYWDVEAYCPEKGEYVVVSYSEND